MRVIRSCFILFVLLAGIMPAAAQQQKIAGDWFGQFLNARAVISLTEKAGKLEGVFKSPDQTTQEFAIDSIRLKGDSLYFSVKALSFRYNGVWQEAEQRFAGAFVQGGRSFTLNFSRKHLTKEDVTPKRPQEPQPPFDYEREDITFTNTKDSVTLSGTFTKPRGKGPFPAILLISGSGPQDRNEEIFNHKPFLVIADYLTRNGIAVLRYDDRGTAKSTGSYAKADLNNFAEDAKAGFNWLQQRADVDKAKTGLLGHSEGGDVIQILAAEDSRVAFIVSLAGPGVNGVKVFELQNYATNIGSGIPDSVARKISVANTRYLEVMAREKNLDSLRRKAVPVIHALYDVLPETLRHGMQKPAFTFQVLTANTTPAMMSLVRFDPALYIPKIKCPVLALNGEKDIQVLSKENLEGWRTLLKKGNNKDATVQELRGLNHLFQACKECIVAEYISLEETISPVVLDTITKWIKQHTGLQK